MLGGSSAINGLYLNRPGRSDIDAWQELIEGIDGAENWDWDAFLSAMKKSETFTPPKDAMAAQGAVAFDASSRGSKGPIQASFPSYSVQWNEAWGKGLQNMGVDISPNTYGGENDGSYISTSAIDPSTLKRSYSRTGYLDAVMPRDNYDVLVNAHVTRLIFDSKSDKNNLTASAVEFSTDGGATKRTVKMKKEVVLAGGTVGSPVVLMHSGIGAKDVLSAAGVDVISELPGVGNHLQDHLLATIAFETTEKTPGKMWVDDKEACQKDPAWLSFINDAVAYVNASRIFGAGIKDFQKATTSTNYSPPGSGKSVQSGYGAISAVTATTMLESTLGQIELLLVTSLYDGTVGITAALQHPYSHGAITIASAYPFQDPLINPNYLTHPSDVILMREGLKLARQLGNTSPFKDTLKSESTPGTKEVSSDADWEKWLKKNVDTEYHPSSTCAMLPLELGGVVDANLKVYGLANVRVADASVPPVALSAHLMGSTYGVAEKAADIIRAYHNLPKDEGAEETGSVRPSKTGSGGDGAGIPTQTGGETTETSSNGGIMQRSVSRRTLLGLWLVAGFMLWS